jgi:5-methylcytosine-specific restriction endonuclease McrA
VTRVVDQSVLVLNRNWQPVAVFSVGVAVTTVVREMGWVLHPESFELLGWETWTERAPEGMRSIKTPSGAVPAPELIVLRAYAGQPKRQVRFNRSNLYRRDRFACQYCGVKPGARALTIDHVQPRSRGGPTSWENCVAACAPCNRRKADKTPAEARMPLRVRPARPSWRPALRVREVRPAWATFVGAIDVGEGKEGEPA